MKNFLYLVFALSPLILMAQENYQKGHVITKEGQKLTGLIDNQYWEISPTEVLFKDDNGITHTYFPKDINEFFIEGKMLYRSYVVLYDSSANLKELSDQFSPELKKSKVFLKFILQSETSLLEYSESTAVHYFLLKNDEVTTLINHVFFSNEDGIKSKRVNPAYIEQLRRMMKDCAELRIDERVAYRKKSLLRLFQQYNSCTGSEHQHIYENEKAKIMMGISALVSYDIIKKGYTGSGGFGYGGGVFMNVMFPHHNYRRSLYTELIYKSFGKQSVSKEGGFFGTTIFEDYDVQSLKATSMFRSKIGKSRRFFIEGGATYSFGLKDQYSYQNGGFRWGATEAQSNGGFVMGTGVAISSKLSAELRYELGGAINFRDTSYLTESSGQSSFSFVALYQF